MAVFTTISISTKPISDVGDKVVFPGLKGFNSDNSYTFPAFVETPHLEITIFKLINLNI